MPDEEMMRPCTLWGETFDAGDVLQIRNTETHVFIDLNTVKLINGHPVFGKVIASPFYDECHVESQKYTLEAITTIADALNAPVLATEEVLAGLPPHANAAFILVDHESNGIKTQMKCFLYWGLKDKKEGWMYREHDLDSPDGESYDYFVDKSDKIYADDPKTAEYLGQFTRQGVRRVG